MAILKRLLILILCLILFANMSNAQEIIEATKNNDSQKIRLIVKKDSASVKSIDLFNSTALHYASEKGNIEIVKYLIDNGADVKAMDVHGDIPMIYAAKAGHLELVKFFIEEGGGTNQCDYHGRSILHAACRTGNLELVSYLVENGADFNSRDQWGSSAVNAAIWGRNLNVIKYLIEKDADPNSALVLAAQTGQTEILKYFIEEDVDINSHDDLGRTALFWTVFTGNQGLVDLLLSYGKNIKLADDQGITMIHVAAKQGNSAMVKYLYDKGLEINAIDYSGRTALHWAMQSGNIDVLKTLLELGADINMKDNIGRTAIQCAAISGNQNMLEFLIKNGASTILKDKNNNSITDYANKYNHLKLSEYLTSAGVKSNKQNDKNNPLTKKLNFGEAITWYTGSSGWAIKTAERLLIFDYVGFGGDLLSPSINNGFINPEELKKMDVYVFVTHAHGDHFNPEIFKWQEKVGSIKYIMGWNFESDDPSIISIANPYDDLEIDDMKISTLYCFHDNVPESAFLIQVDGLSIYDTGDYTGRMDTYKNDIDYLAEKLEDNLDIGLFFLVGMSQDYAIKKLNPNAAFTFHAPPILLEGAGAIFKKNNTGLNLFNPEYRGDRYFYSNKKMIKF